MRVNRIIANLRVGDIDAAKDFYTGFLGLNTEEFNLGWVARQRSPDERAKLQLLTGDSHRSEIFSRPASENRRPARQ